MYRTIDTEIWNDPWFLELEPLDKLLFMYLWTNSRITACGAFEVAVKTISFDSGLSSEQVKEGLQRLAPKVVWWPDLQIVWVVNFYKRQRANGNPMTFAKSAMNRLLKLPAEVRDTIGTHYPELWVRPTETTHTLPTPYPHPTLPSKEAEQNRTESEIDHSSATSTAREEKFEPQTPKEPEPTKRAFTPVPKKPEGALAERMSMQAYLAEGAKLALDKSLTAIQKKTLTEFFNKHGPRITAAMVDYAASETGNYTTSPTLAYFLEIMRAEVEEPNREKKSRSNGSANTNTAIQRHSGSRGNGRETRSEGYGRAMRNLPGRGKAPDTS